MTIRLLDPPLHEFLPKKEEVGEELLRGPRQRYRRVGVQAAVLERIETLSEANPMLGTRGVRLGLLYPEIYEMQADRHAAAKAVEERTGSAGVEVMIPLVGVRARAGHHARPASAAARRGGPPAARRARTRSTGTLIELPRACFLADRIADARRLLLASAPTT